MTRDAKLGAGLGAGGAATVLATVAWITDWRGYAYEISTAHAVVIGAMVVLGAIWLVTPFLEQDKAVRQLGRLRRWNQSIEEAKESSERLPFVAGFFCTTAILGLVAKEMAPLFYPGAAEAASWGTSAGAGGMFVALLAIAAKWGRGVPAATAELDSEVA